MTPSRWRFLFTLSVLATLLVGLSAAARPPKAADPAPAQPTGSVGPIDPRTLQPDDTHTLAVPDGGYTFYIDTHGETVTGAVPDDALMGFTPAATGESTSPAHQLIPCEQPTPQGLRDHATFTDEELDRFGLPHLNQVGNGNLEEWQNIVRLATERSCSWTDSYHDGHVDTAANVGRGSTGVKATMPGHSLAPRHNTTSDYQSNFRWQGMTGVNSWGAWADDAVNFSFPGYYYASEGYTHAINPNGNPNNGLDVRARAAAVWLGIGGFQNNQCTGAPSLVQTGEESTWSVPAPDHTFGFIDNTGSTQNCGVRNVLPYVVKGDLMYMNTGCEYASAPCTHVFVQDQTQPSPNYYGGYMDGPAPNTQSAECAVENPIPDWILPWFGTLDFQFCRVSFSEFGLNYGETGMGNVIPNGHYSVFEQQDKYTHYNCYVVTNFTDANNWTFNIVRDTSVNTQDCD